MKNYTSYHMLDPEDSDHFDFFRDVARYNEIFGFNLQ